MPDNTGAIPRTGAVINGIIKEVRLFAEGDPEWFILFSARGEYAGCQFWSDPIDFHDASSVYSNTLLNALLGAGKANEDPPLAVRFRAMEEKYAGDENVKVTSLGPGSKLIGTAIAVEVRDKNNGRPGIGRFLPVPDEVMEDRRASRAARLDAELERQPRRSASPRRNMQQEVENHLRAHPDDKANAVYRAVGGNRNEVLAIVREIRGRQ